MNQGTIHHHNEMSIRKVNPLEIAEVAALVCKFIPLWSPRNTTTTSWSERDSHTSHCFLPRQLLACSRVNRAWHTAVQPTLWFIYSDFDRIMSTISAKTLVRYAHFFRIIICSSFPRVAMAKSFLAPAIQLQGIEFQGTAHKNALELIHANPHLRNVVWIWPEKKSSTQAQESDSYEALWHLQSLETLRLEGCEVNSNLALLLCTKPALQSLTIEAANINSWDPNSVLMGVKDLSLRISTFDSVLVLANLLCSFPWIKKLELDYSKEANYLALNGVLRASCPLLESLSLQLRRPESLEDELLYILEVDGMDAVPWYTSLIEGAPGLKNLTVAADVLLPQSTSALITSHSKTLSNLVLNLCHPGLDKTAVKRFRLILEHCSNLTSVEFSSFQQPTDLQEVLITKPLSSWACRHCLESLHLHGVGFKDTEYTVWSACWSVPQMGLMFLGKEERDKRPQFEELYAKDARLYGYGYLPNFSLALVTTLQKNAPRIRHVGVNNFVFYRKSDVQEKCQ